MAIFLNPGVAKDKNRLKKKKLLKFRFGLQKSGLRIFFRDIIIWILMDT